MIFISSLKHIFQLKIIRPLAAILLTLIILQPLVIISAGERGVVLRFGQVQPQIFNEGLHPIIPIAEAVKKLTVRVQKREISAEASSKDLQEIETDVVLNWHLVPDEVNLAFQQLGDELAVVDRAIDPAVEEVLKAVMAKYTAEEIITRREEVKGAVDQLLSNRLRGYHIFVDDISLVHVNFSDRFSEAVEAKQIAEQEAKRAEFLTLKAAREAEARVNWARGEAEAQRLLKEHLTPELIQRQAIERWNGQLPTIIGSEGLKLFNLESPSKTTNSTMNR
jgi:regulator of protease activity HflC (stomatin/prohibitin superfamily)